MADARSGSVHPATKASFATKTVNRDLLDLAPRGGTQVRFSLMPRGASRPRGRADRSDPARIAAIDDFVAAGYAVHVRELLALIERRTPWLRVRYAF